jgi:hypothetical protein
LISSTILSDIQILSLRSSFKSMYYIYKFSLISALNGSYSM